MPTYLYVCKECEYKYYKHFKSSKDRTIKEKCSNCDGTMNRQISRPMVISRFRNLEKRRKQGEGYMVDQYGNMLEQIATADKADKKHVREEHKKQTKEAMIRRRFGEKPKPLPIPNQNTLSAKLPNNINQ